MAPTSSAHCRRGRTNHRLTAILVAALVLVVPHTATDAFYLPGVAPQNFKPGDEVTVRVGRVSSAQTHIPYDYYELPLCDPSNGRRKSAPANLGEILSADRYYDAPFTLHALKNETCREVCRLRNAAPGSRGGGGADGLDDEDYGFLAYLIDHDYRVRVRLDNMPGMFLDVRPDDPSHNRGHGANEAMPASTRPTNNGYPFGARLPAQPGAAAHPNPGRLVNNHVTLWISYHDLRPDNLDDLSVATHAQEIRIIGVFLTARSYPSGGDGDGWKDACARHQQTSREGQRLRSGDMRMTYSVKWIKTDKVWATRWDALLSMDGYEHETNWSAIINSILLSLLLGLLVAIILLRSVRNDFAVLRELDADDLGAPDQDATNVAWKLLSRDVFRPPQRAMLLAVLHGNGAQLLWMMGLQMVFALLGFYSPANRGAFLTYSFVAYACLAVVGGRAASRLYGSFDGGTEGRRSLVLLLAMGVPGVAFGQFFLIDIVLWCYKSSGAVSFLVLLLISFLWFGISLPLTFVGAHLGFKKPTEWPIRPNKIPRQVPEKSCFLSLPMVSTFGGITLYSMTFIQVFSIIQKIWLHQFVYMFGFLFLSGLCFVIGCVEIAIITVYLTLCNEDHRWWWRSFLVPASSGVFMFFGTLVYQSFLTSELFSNVRFVTLWMMTSYLGLCCLGVSLIAGSIGLSSCMWFVKLIYARCKPE